MPYLSSNALAFVPLADLLIQLQSLMSQIQPRLLSLDMTSLSYKNINSYPSTFFYFRSFKRFQRAKLWRYQKDSTKQTTSIHHSALVWPHPLFFKYVKDVKTGNVKVDPAPDVSNRAEGGVIHPNSISLISEVSRVTRLLTSLVDNTITSDSVTSTVLTSPFTIINFSFIPHNNCT